MSCKYSFFIRGFYQDFKSFLSIYRINITVNTLALLATFSRKGCFCYSKRLDRHQFPKKFNNLVFEICWILVHFSFLYSLRLDHCRCSLWFITFSFKYGQRWLQKENFGYNSQFHTVFISLQSHTCTVLF